jgi:hypothetical protein
MPRREDCLIEIERLIPFSEPEDWFDIAGLLKEYFLLKGLLSPSFRVFLLYF